jgi:hypothetical protein
MNNLQTIGIVLAIGAAIELGGGRLFDRYPHSQSGVLHDWNITGPMSEWYFWMNFLGHMSVVLMAAIALGAYHSIRGEVSR